MRNIFLKVFLFAWALCGSSKLFSPEDAAVASGASSCSFHDPYNQAIWEGGVSVRASQGSADEEGSVLVLQSGSVPSTMPAAESGRYRFLLDEVLQAEHLHLEHILSAFPGEINRQLLEEKFINLCWKLEQRQELCVHHDDLAESVALYLLYSHYNKQTRSDLNWKKNISFVKIKKAFLQMQSLLLKPENERLKSRWVNLFNGVTPPWLSDQLQSPASYSPQEANFVYYDPVAQAAEMALRAKHAAEQELQSANSEELLSRELLLADEKSDFLRIMSFEAEAARQETERRAGTRIQGMFRGYLGRRAAADRREVAQANIVAEKQRIEAERQIAEAEAAVKAREAAKAEERRKKEKQGARQKAEAVAKAKAEAEAAAQKKLVKAEKAKTQAEEARVKAERQKRQAELEAEKEKLGAETAAGLLSVILKDEASIESAREIVSRDCDFMLASECQNYQAAAFHKNVINMLKSSGGCFYLAASCCREGLFSIDLALDYGVGCQIRSNDGAVATPTAAQIVMAAGKHIYDHPREDYPGISLDSKEQELLIKKLWQDKKTFDFAKESTKPVFSIDTPPPTVSGSLHIGHIFSYLHTDFIARYKRMTGHNVYYPMGFDDNGLPTEKYVEKKLKIRSKDLKRSEFIKLCLSECTNVEKTFKELWQSIGLSVDWNYCYSTIAPETRAVSQKNFLQMLRKGLVYRKKEPALFCTDFQTTVAQAELDTIETNSFFNTLKFSLTGTEESILIATTRPELLPACVAIFVHPQDERYSHLIGTEARVPLFGQVVKIMADDAVIPDKGTGVVMCCTFGDHQDVFWFKKHNLPLIEAIGSNGRMTKVAAFLEGLKVHQAREAVITALKEQELLVEQKAITHDVHIYERSKKEIEYIVSSQWFVKVLDFKEAFLEAGSKIAWYPKFMKSRYDDWVKNLTWDWCISRQRYFGIPFPVWHCQDCQTVLVPDESMLPVDPCEEAYPGGKCSNCGGSNITPDTDVMDTWATSSSTPQINASITGNSTDGFLPMSIRPQAHDIIRTWAFYTIAKAVHIEAALPWKEILISGHVLTGQKEKISKSAGNSQLTPQGLIENFSADAIRFWAAKGRLGLDTMFAEDQLKNGNRLVTKLWNAMKFAHENLLATQFDIHSFAKETQPEDLDILSKYLFHNLYKTSKLYHESFGQHEYSQALEAVDSFFWHTYCDNYLELVKDQVFNPDKYDEKTVANYGYTLYTVSLELLKMYAPFVPFITEAIYQIMFASSQEAASVHQQHLNLEALHKFKHKQAAKDFLVIIETLAAVRKLKSENSLSLKTECSQLVLFASDAEVLKNDLTATNLLLGATKCRNLVLAPHATFINSLQESESGFVIHVNLENKE